MNKNKSNLQKDCEYCSNTKRRKLLYGDGNCWLEISKYQAILATGTLNAYIPIKYCPQCGREL